MSFFLKRIKRFKINRKKLHITLLAVLLILSSLISYKFFFLPKDTKAAWWDEGWLYRQVIVATNGSSYQASSVPYRITLDTASLISANKMQTDGDDIRIVDSDGHIVRHQTEQSTLNTSATGIWFDANISANSSKQYYIYYGNPSAAASSFDSDLTSQTSDGTTVLMNDGFEYNTSTSWGRLSDIKKNSTDIGVNGDYRQTTGYTGGWWDDRPFNRTLLSTGPLFVEVKFEDTNYGNYSSFGTVIQMFDNGFVHNRVFMTYIATASERLYYYLNFDSATRNSVWYNSSGTLIDQAANSGLLYDSDLGHNWFGQRWTATGMYGGNIVNQNGSDWREGQTSAQESYYQTNYSYSQSTDAGNTRHIRWGVFAGDGGLSEMQEKGDLYAMASTTVGVQEVSQAPVGYWKLDEGYGTVAKDSSPNSNHSTTFSGTWTSEDMCVSGKCLSLNGSSNNISMPDSPSLSPTTAVTLEAWINLNATPGDAGKSTPFFTIAQKDGGYSGHGVYGLRIDTSRHLSSTLAYGTLSGEGSTLTGTTVLEKNKWYYVSMTYDQNIPEWKMYINGKLESTNPSFTQPLLDSASVFRIGIGDGRFFSGMIDDVRVYPYARSASEIKADYKSRGAVKGASVQMGSEPTDPDSLSNGLMGYWKMDETSWDGTSGEVKDTSGNSNNGTTYGGTNPVTGKYGNGSNHDATDNAIRISDNPTLNPTNQITISTWLKPDGFTGAYRRVIDKGYDSQYIIYTAQGEPTTSVYFEVNISGTRRSINIANGVSIGNWYHLVATYDGTYLKMYLNGELRTTSSEFPGTLDTTANMLGIGSNPNGGENFNGTLDEVRIYNRALSPSEIKTLYNWAPGPIAYWDFDIGTGNSLIDISGLENNGTWFGTLGNQWVNGKYGKAGNFNGTNNYVNLGDEPEHYTPYAFTFTTWIKRTGNFGVRQMFAGKGNGSSANTTPFWLELNTSNQLVFYISNTGGTASAYCNATDKTITDQNWHHTAFVWNGNTTKVYLDGSPSSCTGNFTGPYNNYALAASLGKLGTSTLYFTGHLDDFKIYNYARSPGQIIEDMNAGHPLGGSPIASQLMYLKLDDGYGTTATDFGYNKDNGDLIDGAAWTNDGKIGKGVLLDGLNDRIQGFGADPFEYTGTGGLSFTVWVKPDSTDTDTGYIMTKPWNGSGEYNYRFRLNADDTLSLTLYGATSWGADTTATITNDAWNYLAFTVDENKTVKIYINGKAVKVDTHNITDWTPPAGDGNTSTILGCYYPYAGGWAGNTGYCIKGIIDEAKIYKAALSEEEIKLDMNQGSSLVMGAKSTDSSGNVDNSSVRSYCPPGNIEGNCAAGQNPSPVGEWKLDERSTGYANDTSGNGNRGSIANASWTNGKAGGALNFDGSGDYVDLGTNSTLSIQGKLTLSAWIKPNTVTPSEKMAIVGKGNTTTRNYDLYIDTDSKLLLMIEGLTVIQVKSLTSLTTNKWYHVAGVYDNDNKLKVYINGIKDNEVATSGTPPVSSANPMIACQGSGACTSYSTTFNGLIDNVLIYNYPRTQSQVAWDYNQGKPVGWWKLDDCQGNTAVDSSGNNAYGTITIGATIPQTSTGTCSTSGTAWGNGSSGKYNASLNFDGADDYLTIPGNNSLKFGSGDFTVSFWTYRTATGLQGGSYFSKGTYTTGIDTYDTVFRVNTSTGELARVTLSATLDQWQHHTLVVTQASTPYIKHYINGKLDNTGYSAPGNLGTYTNADASNLVIGYSNAGGVSRYFNGKIDDFRVYNYSLNPTQVKNIYNEGSAVRFGP